MEYEVIIIGAGPAGLSAAIYCVRKKLKTLVLTHDIGGQILKAHSVDNYLGIPGVSGVELLERFHDHADKLQVPFKDGLTIEKIEKIGDAGFRVNTGKGELEAETLIICTGKQYRQLNVPGGKEFEGRGVTYCATCDAPLYKNKKVAVIGGGDAGQDTADQLSKYAEKVYIINMEDALKGENHHVQEKLWKDEKVEIINTCFPIEVKGEKFVKGVIYSCKGIDDKKILDVDGVFVEMGSVPASGLVKDIVKLNDAGEIIVDHKTNSTSCPGMFAAGDVTDVPFKQMVIAAGEGAKAALSVCRYLKDRKK
jgi:thioredoxin-disulfide reductase